MGGLVEQFNPDAMQRNGPAEGLDKRRRAILRAEFKPGRSNSRAPMEDMLAGGLPKATEGAGTVGTR